MDGVLPEGMHAVVFVGTLFYIFAKTNFMLHHKNTSLELITEEIDGVVYVEEFRAAAAHEGLYEISNFGRLKRLGHYLKSGKWNPDRIIVANGSKKKLYPRAHLRKNKKSTSISIHRLVAFAFIPLVEGKDHVNHKDCKHTNNFYKNLEWCTPQENNEHGVMMGVLKRGRKPPKPYVKKGRAHVKPRYKKIIDITNGTVYNSPKELSEKTGMTIKKIHRTLSGERYNHTNFRYVGQENLIRTPEVKEKPLSPIGVFDMDGNVVTTYSYFSQAAEFVGCTSSDINAFLKGRKSYVKGYKFKAMDENLKYIEPLPFISTKPPLKPKRIPQPVTPSKVVIKTDLQGNELQRFASFGEACKHSGANKSNLRKAMKGKIKGRPGYYKGFFYRYAPF